MTRSPLRPVLLAWFALLLFTLAWDASGLDVAVMQAIGTPTGFEHRHTVWLERVLHDGLRQAMVVVLVLATGWALWTVRRRPQRLGAVALVWLSLLVVGIVKSHSLTSCPWDWQAFGGPALPVSHWAWGLLDGGPGRCFPGGHAASGFSFLALAWPAAAPARFNGERWWRWVLGLALAIGLLAGVVQTVRGAHPPSHTAWTFLICATVALAGARLRLPAPADVQGQVNGHAANDGAQHPALPVEPGHAGRSGEQARVLPGAGERALGHDHLGHDHG